jgi:DNA anti-recombination protein RmuC
VDANQPRSSAPAVPTLDARAASEEGTGNIDKVRDIIFGGQMREYERRFARLEERLLQETAELRDDVRKRLAALEQFATGETASLADRLKAERDERSDAEKELARGTADAVKAFEKKTGQIDDTISRVQRELRQQMLELHQRMTDDLRQKIDEVLTRLGREATDLRTDKADRSTLAALLTEMAMRLTNDLSVPGSDDGRHG